MAFPKSAFLVVDRLASGPGPPWPWPLNITFTWSHPLLARAASRRLRLGGPRMAAKRTEGGAP